MKIFKNFIFLSVPSLIILFLILELFFRFVLPASSAPACFFDSQMKILKYDSSLGSKGLFTIGKSAHRGGKWRINNYGWNSDIDYLPYPKSKKPLIAIIGDSQVESLQVDIDKNFAALLRSKVDDKFSVYTSGISGAPLSHYLYMSRYVTKLFNPDVIVFNVVYNDFAESIAEIVPKPSFWQLRYSNGLWQDTLTEAGQPSRLAKMLRRSALVRYLLINLHSQSEKTRLYCEYRCSHCRE